MIHTCANCSGEIQTGRRESTLSNFHSPRMYSISCLMVCARRWIYPYFLPISNLRPIRNHKEPRTLSFDKLLYSKSIQYLKAQPGLARASTTNSHNVAVLFPSPPQNHPSLWSWVGEFEISAIRGESSLQWHMSASAADHTRTPGMFACVCTFWKADIIPQHNAYSNPPGLAMAPWDRRACAWGPGLVQECTLFGGTDLREKCPHLRALPAPGEQSNSRMEHAWFWSWVSSCAAAMISSYTCATMWWKVKQLTTVELTSHETKDSNRPCVSFRKHLDDRVDTKRWGVYTISIDDILHVSLVVVFTSTSEHHRWV